MIAAILMTNVLLNMIILKITHNTVIVMNGVKKTMIAANMKTECPMEYDYSYEEDYS